MRLGTCLPSHAGAASDKPFTLEESVHAIADAGIRGCLTNFVGDESKWESTSEALRRVLEGAGVSLLEYHPSDPSGRAMELQPADPSGRAEHARKLVRALEIAEEIGALNCLVCPGGFGNGSKPHPKNRSQEAWDTLKDTAVLIADGAAKLGLRARLQVEPIYTSRIWSAEVMTAFVEEVGSPNIQGHMDIANCFTFDDIFDLADVIRNAFRVVGLTVHSAHMKDVQPMESYFPNIEECLVGEGIMDFRTYLTCLDGMPAGFSVVIEHMASLDDIVRSYRRMCDIADEVGVAVWDEGEHAA